MNTVQNTNNKTKKAVNILTGVIFTALSMVLIFGVGSLIIDMFSTGLKYY
jgi:hypothetical protein